MPEILTESFCERCGTRYTFEAAAPKGRRLGKIKVLSKGLVNFVTNDDQSLDEAFADARSDQQRELTGHQLEAFHKTFQFCMSCRQYTCGNCWNEADGQCLSCAPHLGQEILEAPFPALGAAAIMVPDAAGSPNGQNGHDAPIDFDAVAWPSIDLPADDEAPGSSLPSAAATPPPASAADAETAAAAEALAEAEAEAEAVATAAAEAEAVADRAGHRRRGGRFCRSRGCRRGRGGGCCCRSRGCRRGRGGGCCCRSRGGRCRQGRRRGRCCR